MKILFMGTPDFARVSLEALIASRHEIVGVVTRQDKPTGRHHVLTAPPVKECALENDIEVLQPQTLRTDEFMDTLREKYPDLDLIVVVAYGRILPLSVLEYPKYGCINLHGSLLPKYRGAAPMQRAVMAGEEKVGVTVMRMADGVDTGNMIRKSSVDLPEDADFEFVHDTLALIGSKLLVEVVDEIEEKENALTEEVQDDSLATYAEKIENSDCELDFSKSAREIHDTVRGLCPVPYAFTTLKGKKLKVAKTALIKSDKRVNALPGAVVSIDGGVITVSCAGGEMIAITRVLPEGKRLMDASDFIRGRGVDVGDILGR